MSVPELIREIESYGVTLKTKGGQIYFKPKDALPRDVVDCIRKEKENIMLYLQDKKYSLNVFSHVLGCKIIISWYGNNPKVIYINRTPYTPEEIDKLKKADSEEVRAACLVKETFDGKIIEYCKNEKNQI